MSLNRAWELLEQFPAADLKQIDKKIKDVFYSREMRTKFEEARKNAAIAAQAKKKADNKLKGHPTDSKDAKH